MFELRIEVNRLMLADPEPACAGVADFDPALLPHRGGWGMAASKPTFPRADSIKVTKLEDRRDVNIPFLTIPPLGT